LISTNEGRAILFVQPSVISNRSPLRDRESQIAGSKIAKGRRILACAFFAIFDPAICNPKSDGDTRFPKSGEIGERGS